MVSSEYGNIIKTKEQIEKEYQEIHIENNIIKNVRIKVIGHFNNCICISIDCENISLLNGYNNTSNIGYILRFLVEFFNKSDDNGVDINILCNTPIRLIFDSNDLFEGKCIAIGHFMEDKFVYLDDIINLHK